MSEYTKDPSAVLDYQINWGTWLDTDTISTSAWTAEAGITIDSDTSTTTTATVWLSGGTTNRDYEVVNTITTAAGRTDQRTITIRCRDR